MSTCFGLRLTASGSKDADLGRTGAVLNLREVRRAELLDEGAAQMLHRTYI